MVKMTVSLLASVGLLLAWSAPAALPSKGEAEHVALIIWDGLRPDFVMPQFALTLFGLATNGVFFRNHHPSYISSTEVNGTAVRRGVDVTETLKWAKFKAVKEFEDPEPGEVLVVSHGGSTWYTPSSTAAFISTKARHDRAEVNPSNCLQPEGESRRFCRGPAARTARHLALDGPPEFLYLGRDASESCPGYCRS
jgi:hypothetical protein